MKGKLVVFALVTGLSSPAAAQTIMDGSDSKIPPDVWGNAKEAIMNNLRDPYSTQFDHLKVTSSEPQIICGRFNAKNQAGGYEGFQPFQFNAATKELVVNQSNECGAATVDEAARRAVRDRIFAECHETIEQLDRYASGGGINGSFTDLMAKGNWCQDWLKRQMEAELDQITN